jgi:hypothetical protein
MTLPDDFIIEHEGGTFPYQAEGTFGEDIFYFRYRSDNAQLSVGPPADKSVRGWCTPLPAHPPRLYAEIFGVFDDPMRGWLSKEEAHELMGRLVPMLKPPVEWEYGTHHDRLAAMLDAIKAKDEKKED